MRMALSLVGLAVASAAAAHAFLQHWQLRMALEARDFFYDQTASRPITTGLCDAHAAWWFTLLGFDAEGHPPFAESWAHWLCGVGLALGMLGAWMFACHLARHLYPMLRETGHAWISIPGPRTALRGVLFCLFTGVAIGTLSGASGWYISATRPRFELRVPLDPLISDWPTTVSIVAFFFFFSLLFILRRTRHSFQASIAPADAGCRYCQYPATGSAICPECGQSRAHASFASTLWFKIQHWRVAMRYGFIAATATASLALFSYCYLHGFNLASIRSGTALGLSEQVRWVFFIPPHRTQAPHIFATGGRPLLIESTRGRALLIAAPSTESTGTALSTRTLWTAVCAYQDRASNSWTLLQPHASLASHSRSLADRPPPPAFGDYIQCFSTPADFSICPESFSSNPSPAPHQPDRCRVFVFGDHVTARPFDAELPGVVKQHMATMFANTSSGRYATSHPQ